jgi:hypothetical protein
MKNYPVGDSDESIILEKHNYKLIIKYEKFYKE